MLNIKLNEISKSKSSLKNLESELFKNLLESREKSLVLIIEPKDDVYEASLYQIDSSLNDPNNGRMGYPKIPSGLDSIERYIPQMEDSMNGIGFTYHLFIDKKLDKLYNRSIFDIIDDIIVRKKFDAIAVVVPAISRFGDDYGKALFDFADVYIYKNKDYKS